MENDPNAIKKNVKEGYGKIARDGSSCCPASSCCGGSDLSKNISKAVGYSEREMEAVPDEANLGLGCGNPVAIASLKEGDVVLDLGSGAGFDAFLAAAKVGRSGKVIGVDMTPEMVARATENARKGKYNNVEFKLGDIEKLPIEADSVDVIISNCVINLSTDKETVFKEAYRVLKPGGRMMVSDLVLIKDLPQAIKDSVEAYVGCLAGAVKKDDYIGYMKNAGFGNIKVISQAHYPIEAMAHDATAKARMENCSIKDLDLADIEKSVVSVKIQAVKP